MDNLIHATQLKNGMIISMDARAAMREGADMLRNFRLLGVETVRLKKKAKWYYPKRKVTVLCLEFNPPQRVMDANLARRTEREIVSIHDCVSKEFFDYDIGPDMKGYAIGHMADNICRRAVKMGLFQETDTGGNGGMGLKLDILAPEEWKRDGQSD